MKIHQLQRSQQVKAIPSIVWQFITAPKNLVRITPADMQFEIVSENLPEAIYPGMMIEYRVRPISGLNLRVTWLTEITQVKENVYFVDEQRVGPYVLWHHEHKISTSADGGTLIWDKVTYALPGGFLGELAHRLMISRRLEEIFDYRLKKFSELMG